MLRIRLDEVEPGDVLLSGGLWKVLAKDTGNPKLDPDEVDLKLSKGRTDPGTWFIMQADEEVEVYRPEE